MSLPRNAVLGAIIRAVLTYLVCYTVWSVVGVFRVGGLGTPWGDVVRVVPRYLSIAFRPFSNEWMARIAAESIASTAVLMIGWGVVRFSRSRGRADG